MIKRNDNVFYLPENKNDSLIEEHFASLCASIAFSRHVGTIEEAYTHGGLVYYQTGKDLTDTRYLIGTGGVIVNNSNNKEILKSVLTRKDKPHELRPVNPKILIDKGYLLSAIGLLSQVDKKKALELLKKEILKKEQIKW